MSIGFLAILGAVLLFTTGNYIDTYLLSKSNKNNSTEAILIFSTLVSGTIMFIVLMIMFHSVFIWNVNQFLFMLGCAMLYAFGSLVYFYILKDGETVSVAAFKQLVPVVSRLFYRRYF